MSEDKFPKKCSPEWHELICICPYCDWPEKIEAEKKWDFDAYSVKEQNRFMRLNQDQTEEQKAYVRRMLNQTKKTKKTKVKKDEKA